MLELSFNNLNINRFVRAHEFKNLFLNYTRAYNFDAGMREFRTNSSTKNLEQKNQFLLQLSGFILTLPCSLVLSSVFVLESYKKTVKKKMHTKSHFSAQFSSKIAENDLFLLAQATSSFFLTKKKQKVKFEASSNGLLGFKQTY